MAFAAKTQQIATMTITGIEENLGHMPHKQEISKVSICDPIKIANWLKVTAGHPPRNNNNKDVPQVIKMTIFGILVLNQILLKWLVTTDFFVPFNIFELITRVAFHYISNFVAVMLRSLSNQNLCRQKF